MATLIGVDFDRYAVRSVVNMVTLATPAGWLLARGAGCRVERGARGLLLAGGYRPAVPRAAAFTVGNVILMREPVPPDVLAHEERHAWQWACCLGVFGFPVLYIAAAAWSWIITGDAHSGNAFERRAGLAAGGYRQRPVRWRRGT